MREAEGAGDAEKTRPPDFFRLNEKVEQRVDPEANHVFDDCESLVKAVAMRDPLVRESYLGGVPIALPVYEKSKHRRYQLERVVDPSGIIYTYRRLGVGHERAGFRLTRIDMGPTILQTLSTEDPPVDDAAVYKEMIVEAGNEIKSYAKKLIPVESLSNYKNVAIAPDSRKKQILQAIKGKWLMRPFTAPYYKGVDGGLHRFKGFSDEQREKVPGKRHVSATRLALIAALYIPGYSSGVVVGDVVLPKPAVIEALDDVMNASEHKRQAFDAQGITLPPESSIVVPPLTPVVLEQTSPLSPDFVNRLGGAPVLDGGSASKQDLYGGPRRLTNMGNDTSVTDDASDLDVQQCEDIIVRFAGADKLLVTNVGASISGRISIELLRDKVVICNISDEDVDEEYMESIYVQVAENEQ